MVDIVISDLEEGGLDEIVAAFDLDISFDTNILTAKVVSFGPLLGDPSISEVLFDSDIVSTPGIVDLAGVSLLSDDDLAALQPDSFVLATLSFTAIGAGTSPLSFVSDPVFGLDIKGRDALILELSAEPGSVNVESVVGIPETPAAILFALGFVLLSFARRKSDLVPTRYFRIF